MSASADFTKGSNISIGHPRIGLIQQENQGVSAARNRGIDVARAELVAFLDADDEWLPGFLETILRLRRKFPGAEAYATAYYIQYLSRLQKVNIRHLPSGPWEGIIPRFFQIAAKNRPIVTSSSVWIPKSVFNKIGYFMVDRWWGEDIEMWGRIALHYHIAFSRESGAVYHRDAINRATERRKTEMDHPFMQTGSDYIIKDKWNISASDLSDLQEYMEMLKLQVAGRALKSGDLKVTREMVRECNVKNHCMEKYIIYLVSFLPRSVCRAVRTIHRKYL